MRSAKHTQHHTPYQTLNTSSNLNQSSFNSSEKTDFDSRGLDNCSITKPEITKFEANTSWGMDSSKVESLSWWGLEESIVKDYLNTHDISTSEKGISTWGGPEIENAISSWGISKTNSNANTWGTPKTNGGNHTWGLPVDSCWVKNVASNSCGTRSQVISPKSTSSQLKTSSTTLHQLFIQLKKSNQSEIDHCIHQISNYLEQNPTVTSPREIALIFNRLSKLSYKKINIYSMVTMQLAKLALQPSNINLFTSQGIALIFNFCSKLKNPLAPPFGELLRALIPQAIQISETFKAEEIAMVFNLVAKLDDPLAPPFGELLRALIPQAIQISETFKAEEIAMVFNLVAKLDDPLATPFGELLRALIPQAIQISETFNAPGIAMVFNLVAKLDDPLAPPFEVTSKEIYPWIYDLQNHITKWASQTWEAFKEKLLAKNARHFNLFKTSTREALYSVTINDFDSCGAIESLNPAYYFKSSIKVREYAIHFLKTFWENPRNERLTIEAHQEKTKQNKKLSMSPACISFIFIKENKDIEKEQCLIALSAINKYPELSSALSAHVNELNRNENYLLLHDSINEFNDFLKENKMDASKCCAEKIFISHLQKRVEDNPNLRVIGVINYLFYPYKANRRYGQTPNSLDSTVKPLYFDYHSRNNTVDDRNIIFQETPCCQSCMQNKPAALAFLKIAQHKGEINKNRMEEQHRLLTFHQDNTIPC